MTTLADLTLKQLTAIYGLIAQAEVRAKTFNGRARAISRLTALLAEKNLTVADALKAAGIEMNEPTAETPTPAPADLQHLILITAAGREDRALLPLPATIPPGDWERWIASLTGQGLVEEVAAHFSADYVREDEQGRRLMLRVSRQGLAAIGIEPAEDETEAAPAPATADAPCAGAILASPQVSAEIQTLVFKALIDAGLSETEARAAALRAGNALSLPAGSRPTPKAPRTGTKQDIVIEMLRRPEGATIEQMMEATGWQSRRGGRAIAAGAFWPAGSRNGSA